MLPSLISSFSSLMLRTAAPPAARIPASLAGFNQALRSFGNESGFPFASESSAPDLFAGVRDDDFKPSIARSVVDIRRTTKVTKGGKINSYSVMVVVGNGRGGAGYGLGKALNMAEATRKATAKATKDMRFIPRYQNSTIYHPIDHVFHKTKIRLWPARMDYGMRTHHAIQSICQCAGIQALGGKVYGARNVINVVRGTFEALENQETHLDRARRLGLKAIDLQQTLFDRQMEANERHNQAQLELLKAKLSQNASLNEISDDQADGQKKRSRGNNRKLSTGKPPAENNICYCCRSTT